MKKKTGTVRKSTRGKPVSPRVPHRRNPHRHDQPTQKPFALSDWGDTRDAAIYMNANEEWLRRMVKLGRVPAYTVSGESASGATIRRRPTSRPKPRYRFRRQDLDAWLMAGRVCVKLAEVHPVSTADVTEVAR
jgi:hypothetical protein